MAKDPKAAVGETAGAPPEGAGAAELPPPRPPRFVVRASRRRPHRASALSSTPVKNEINVTPLVDVVLVLLIIFMVVTPMLSRGIAVDLPETLHHEKKTDTGKEVVVSVQVSGNVFIDTGKDNDHSCEDLRPDNAAAIVGCVRVAMAKHESQEVHVKADRRLTYGKVRAILEHIHEAGAPSVALGTEEHKKEGP